MATETQAPVTQDSTDQANAKLNKVELMKKFKQHRDSVNNAIIGLQKDSLVLAKDLDVCKADLGKLTKELEQADSLAKSLQTQLDVAIKQQSPVAALASPSGCAVLIVLIIAITAIALKKGFSIAKGDTKLSVGGDDKKEK